MVIIWSDINHANLDPVVTEINLNKNWDNEFGISFRSTTPFKERCLHYSDAIMNTMASQITGVQIIYSTVCSGANQRKHQNSASLAFVRGIPVNSPHKGPVTRKMFPFHEVIMYVVQMKVMVLNDYVLDFLHITRRVIAWAYHSKLRVAFQLWKWMFQ